MTMHTHTAKKEGDQIRFQLKDPAGRTVADGTCPTLSAAQEDALERATNGGAQAHLGQVKYPETLTE
jgi:hypothetical protein